MVRNSRGFRVAAILIYQRNRLEAFIKGRLKGQSSFKNYTSPSLLKEVRSSRVSKRGKAPLFNLLPPLL